MKRIAFLVIVMLAGCQNHQDLADQKPTVNRALVRPNMVAVPDTKYEISVVSVTNEQYQEFLKATGKKFPSTMKFPLWAESQHSEDLGNHPVAMVTKDEAQAYCDWLSSQLGQRFVLPTKEIYKKAMKGAKSVSHGHRAFAETRKKHANDKKAKKRDELLKGQLIVWYPLTRVREYPEFRSGIGCYVQGQSFYECVSDEGVVQQVAWHSIDRRDGENQRWFWMMHGPSRLYCVIGFRVAKKIER
jgi:hypothetical protein